MEDGMDERGTGAEDANEEDVPPAPGRAGRPPDEGPAADGGSGLDEDDAAADDEIGGGD